MTSSTNIACMLCLAALAGCTVAPSALPTTAAPAKNARTNLQGINTQRLFGDFVAEVSNLTEQFPELSGFSEYALERTAPLSIQYSRGMKSSRMTPDGVKRSFDSKGLYLWFCLTQDYDVISARAQNVTDFPNLQSKLFTDMAFADDVSDGLAEALRGLVKKYKLLLSELDKKSANNPSEATR